MNNREIVEIEWDFMQHVHNIGGRAACQDDPETFFIQRLAQFDAFSEEVNKAYLEDLKQAKALGRNLMTEKYAYMMETTDPDYYETIKDQLVPIDEQKKNLVNALCSIEVTMRRDFNERYPHLATLTRPTSTDEDEIDETSFETYLRCELYTYSDYTLYLYSQMILDMVDHNENLVVNIMANTAKGYGYKSLEEAEKKRA